MLVSHQPFWLVGSTWAGEAHRANLSQPKNQLKGELQKFSLTIGNTQILPCLFFHMADRESSSISLCSKNKVEKNPICTYHRSKITVVTNIKAALCV